jgi:hypothetical protein
VLHTLTGPSSELNASLQGVGPACICCQDLLWEELTAYDHMLLLARFKGVPTANIPAHVSQRLDAVRCLYGVPDVSHPPPPNPHEEILCSTSDASPGPFVFCR